MHLTDTQFTFCVSLLAIPVVACILALWRMKVTPYWPPRPNREPEPLEKPKTYAVSLLLESNQDLNLASLKVDIVFNWARCVGTAIAVGFGDPALRQLFKSSKPKIAWPACAKPGLRYYVITGEIEAWALPGLESILNQPLPGISLAHLFGGDAKVPANFTITEITPTTDIQDKFPEA